MICPHCGCLHSRSKGRRRRLCKGCGKSYTLNPQKPGPAKTYASAAEKQAAYRRRNGRTGNEARQAKKDTEDTQD